MTIKHEQKAHFGFERNLSMQNGQLELIVATEFGPRIMFLGLRDRPNLFAEVPPQTQRKATDYGDDWHIYGGHRLWYAPEHPERSYFPDNRSVRVQRTAQGARVTQEVEAHSGLEKSIEVALSPREAHVMVTHTLVNRGDRTIELAPWALSAMAPGGTAIFPHSPFAPHPDALAPARPLVLWPFTRMNDPRWTWGDRFFYLRQDSAATAPQKVGFYDDRGYMAYALGEQLFLKCHAPKSGAHADFGCNAETFSNELFLELETLGPQTRLASGEAVEHVEHWFVFDGISVTGSESELEASLAPLLTKVRSVFPLPP
jgi:hypothetical protein